MSEPEERAPSSQPELHRSIGPFQLFAYTLGGMLGAGIYGLVGRAAGELGNAVWLGFAVAMVAALLTGLSYASLGSRYPRAGGAAYITQRAYGMQLLTWLVGLAVMASGLTSVATQSRVVALNLLVLFPIGAPPFLVALGFLLVVTGVVLRGIRESMAFNIVCTAVEFSGLAFVILVGIPFWGSVDLLETPSSEGISASLLLSGAILTFFSFIGFEDSLNVAEECHHPARTVPIGIVTAMLAATLLYMAIAVTAVSVVPFRELAQAPSPLAAVTAVAAPWFPLWGYVAITLFAVANTALLNYVTASRLAYGMARDGFLPEVLARVHPGRRTPHISIQVLLVVLVALLLAGDISQLAAATVLLLLTVFTLVNGALFILQRRPGEPHGGFEVPSFVPAAGAVVCLILLVNRVMTGDWHAPALAGAILAAILVLYVVMPPRNIIHRA
ncbi:APC family permease [Roseomonas xinghualingensis]|uniref:APC family permease n=1 Tax=Roseomonas xinghualingensis TaxID=2986475 RepID=UPI0021F20EC9|nr:amino acid permease [Roseomonas sp. SXEYE001]MCV4206301.1 amino acid permease [Roseomonas sp. SXEYE001]